jgi:aryl-alcohol dehydrogenase-like predicted oxidoreductase
MTKDVNNPFVLGTVQFGLPYGVANKIGQPDQARVTEIVRTAWEQGIREFDTAQDYGLSETALGRAFAALGIAADVKVISKIDPTLDHCDRRVMETALRTSLDKLKVPGLYGLLLHKEQLLDQWPNGLGDILRGFVASGRVNKLGVSTYAPDRALAALKLAEVDLVQMPSNILDRRFERAGVFKLAAQKNKQLYIRSVFLQGLILMASEDLPPHMSFAGPVLRQIKALAQELGLTRQELALGYLKAKMPEAKLIIGVDLPGQVAENMKAWERGNAANLVASVGTVFAQLDEKVLNPALWSAMQ